MAVDMRVAEYRPPRDPEVWGLPREAQYVYYQPGAERAYFRRHGEVWSVVVRWADGSWGRVPVRFLRDARTGEPVGSLEV